jgi:uncharacterized membrane protein
MSTSAVANASPRTVRVGSIDAARGAAMLFVCLSHFSGTYLYQTGAEDVGAILAVTGMIASPTFVAVSGLVAGFLAVTNPVSFPHVRRKLIDRGVFLLVVGHILLAITDLPDGFGFAHAYRIGFITDAIAVAVMIGPWLVVKLSRKHRLLLAVTLFALNWCATIWWIPTGQAAILLKHYLIGIADPGAHGLPFPVYPVIPWFCVYLAATILGQHVGAYYLRGDKSSANKFLARVGGISLFCALLIRSFSFLIRKQAPGFTQIHSNLMLVLSAYQKFPPGPVYLSFFGGAGMLLVCVVLELERRRSMTFAVEQMRQMGQASLFVYVGQFYLFAVGLRELQLPYTRFWPVLFLLSVAILARGAKLWNAHDGNQFLTVGLTYLLERKAKRKPKMFKPA